MSRIQQQQPDERDPKLGPGDYFVVSAGYGEWYVSTEMARFIEQALDAEVRPLWIKFVDIVGARVRLRTKDVTFVRQSTPDQRAASRAFRQSLREEAKPNRPWDDDEW